MVCARRPACPHHGGLARDPALATNSRLDSGDGAERHRVRRAAEEFSPWLLPAACIAASRPRAPGIATNSDLIRAMVPARASSCARPDDGRLECLAARRAARALHLIRAMVRECGPACPHHDGSLAAPGLATNSNLIRAMVSARRPDEEGLECFAARTLHLIRAMVPTSPRAPRRAAPRTGSRAGSTPRPRRVAQAFARAPALAPLSLIRATVPDVIACTALKRACP